MSSYSTFRAPGGPTGLPGLDGAPAQPYLVANWSYPLVPAQTGPSAGIWMVPYHKGAQATFTLLRARLRFETVITGYTATLRIQKSVGSGVFTPVDLCTLSFATSGAQEVTVTSFAVGTVQSGDLLRLTWDSVISGATIASIQLEGSA